MTTIYEYLDAPDPADVDAGFNGLKLPALTGGASWDKVIPGGCVGCAKAADGDATHNCWAALKLAGTAAQKKAAMQQVFNAQNQHNHFARKVMGISQLLHTMQHGIAGFDEQDLVNATNAFGPYEITAVGDRQLTLKWDGTAGQDPNRLVLSVFGLNPDWIPGFNARYITETPSIRLPARGILKVSNTFSILAGHAGWLIKKVSVPADLEAGGTFTVYTWNQVGADIMTLAPLYEDEDPVAASIEFYVGGYKENWPNPRDVMPLWAAQETVDWPAPFDTAQILTLNYRCRTHSSLDFWVSASAHVIETGGSIDLSAAARAAMVITRSGGSYITKFDFTGVDLSAYDHIYFTVWKENTSTGEYVGQCTCANDLVDWSNSHGDEAEVGSGLRFCSKALTASGYLAGRYVPGNCYLSGDCNQFTEDQATTPYGYAMYEAILKAIPFRLRQLLEGYAIPMLDRMGPPSLLSNSPGNQTVPVSYAPVIVPYKTGGWDRAVMGDDGYHVPEGAFELSWFNNNPGVAGEAIPARTKGNGGAEDRLINQAQILLSSCDTDPYHQTVLSEVGRSQLALYTDIERIDLVAPDISGSYLQRFPGGFIRIGQWDANFQQVGSGGTYYALIQLDPTHDRYNRGISTIRQRAVAKLSAEIVAVTDNGGGSFTLDLRNQQITCSSFHPTLPRQNISHSWCSSGTNVAIEDGKRVNNMSNAATYGRRGPMRHLSQAGDGVKFTDSTFGNKIRNQVMMISAVSPASGALQDWQDTGSPVENWAMQFRPFVVAIGSADETISSITVTRNSGGVTLTGYEGFPFPTSLVKDVYVYSKWPNDDGSAGIAFKFSHLNMNASVTADCVVSISIVTSATTYTLTDINLTSNATYGESVRDVLEIQAGSAITAISVEAEYIDPATGASATAAVTEVTFASGRYDTFTDFSYMKLASSSTHWYLFFAPQLSGAFIRAQVTVTTAPSMSNDDFYDDVISIHSASLPQMEHNSETYETYGRRGDQITFTDEQGMFAAEASGAVGKTIEVGDYCLAVNSSAAVPTIKRAIKQESSPDPDTTLTAGVDYIYIGPKGQIWLTFNPTGFCIFIENLPQVDRRRHPLASELDSIAQCIDGLVRQ